MKELYILILNLPARFLPLKYKNRQVAGFATGSLQVSLPSRSCDQTKPADRRLHSISNIAHSKSDVNVTQYLVHA